jgi:hypothetical protein
MDRDLTSADAASSAVTDQAEWLDTSVNGSPAELVELPPSTIAGEAKFMLDSNSLRLHDAAIAAETEDGEFSDKLHILGWHTDRDDSWTTQKALHGESAAQHRLRMQLWLGTLDSKLAIHARR